MTSQGLFRLSGLAMVLGATLFVIGNLLHPIDHSAASEATATWEAAHISFTIGAAIMALGLPGVYLLQARAAGWLGLLGMTSLFFGLIAIVPGGFYEAFVVKPAGEQIADTIEQGGGGLFLLITAQLFLIGTAFLGIASWRARVYPRIAVALTLVSLPLLVVAPAFGTTVEGVTIITGTVLFGVGYGWFGLHLVRAMSRSETAVPVPVPVDRIQRAA